MDRDPLDRDPPWTEIPLDRDPLGQRLPSRNMGPETETLLKGTWDQSSRQEVTSYRDPPCGHTDTCKKITLPKISFVCTLDPGFESHRWLFNRVLTHG